MKPISCLFAILLAGCATVSVGTQISPAQIGTKYARLSGYMATRGAAPGGRHTEEMPHGVRHDALIDEATLASVQQSETCVDVVVRTSIDHDEPLEQYETKFEFDSHATRAVVEDEKVTVIDYTFQGVRNVVSAEGVSATAYLALNITQPTEQIVRVIERRGRFCGSGGTASSVYLELVHPRWDVAAYHYHLGFNWRIR
jgi:hypothetical protein